MNAQTRLEHGYRRLIGWYPQSFRDESGPEILAVLMDGARPGQRRPSPAETVDLITGGLLMRLRRRRPRPPRAVTGALGLMYLAAVLSATASAAIALTLTSSRTTYLHEYPGVAGAHWSSVATYLVLRIVGAAVAGPLWLVLAWAIAHGRAGARRALVGYSALLTIVLITSAATGEAGYAPVALLSVGVLWLISLGTVVLLFRPEAEPHFTAPVG